MRIFINLLLSIFIITSMVSEPLYAENPDYPLTIDTRINLCAANTGITSKIVLNTSIPETGWDFRVALNKSVSELPEIFIRYNHLNFLSQFGSVFISGLPYRLDNPFSVNDYKDFFSQVSVSLFPIPLAVMSNSRRYPEVLLGWKMPENWFSAPGTLYAYAVPPGLNEPAHYRAGLFGSAFLKEQTIQIGTLLHGIQSSDTFIEDSDWYSEALQDRGASKEGLSAGITLFRENECSRSGIIGLVALDSYRKSGFMAGGAISLQKGFLNMNYFQSLYSPSYPIIFSGNSNRRAALHTGTLLLELPKIMSISVKLSEEINSVDWNFREGTEAERSCTTGAEIELGMAVIKVEDFLLYSYPVNGQKVTVSRVLSTDCCLDLRGLEIVTNFSVTYTDRHFREIDKFIELNIKTGNISCLCKIDFSRNIQQSSIELKYTRERSLFTIKVDSNGKYQAAVTVEI